MDSLSVKGRGSGVGIVVVLFRSKLAIFEDGGGGRFGIGRMGLVECFIPRVRFSIEFSLVIGARKADTGNFSLFLLRFCCATVVGRYEFS